MEDMANEETVTRKRPSKPNCKYAKDGDDDGPVEEEEGDLRPKKKSSRPQNIEDEELKDPKFSFLPAPLPQTWVQAMKEARELREANEQLQTERCLR